MSSKIVQLIRFALSLCLMAGIASAQQAPPPTKPPSSKAGVKRETRISDVPPSASVSPAMAPSSRAPEDGITSERSIAVDPNANIKLCVADGNLRVNGWERPEIRIFVKNGRGIGVRVLEKDPGSEKPVWILLSGTGGLRPGALGGAECLSGERIEIDVPVKATISVAGHTTATTIDSVKKASVKNIEGNISLRNIPGGIMASTYQGDITVENSGGAISLESANGNIVGYEVSPGQIGDLFKAKTQSGAISLQRLEHRQIEANSITGSVLFNGKFLPGGIYSFNTSNGAIRLLVPGDSSCTIVASYGFGQFNSELPLNYTMNNISSSGKSLTATAGAGDARVNITTTSGSIGIKRQ